MSNPTIVVSARVDLAALANIVIYLQGKGIHPTTQSELVRLSIALLERKLGGTKLSTEEALKVLEQSFMSKSNRVKINRTIIEALQEESISEVASETDSKLEGFLSSALKKVDKEKEQ